MKKFLSPLRVSSYYNDDIWGKIFRFNKCVKAFKYIAYSSSPVLKRRFRWKFNVNSNYFFKRTRLFSLTGLTRKVNSFGRRLYERSKMQYFYGKLTKYEFRTKLAYSKGKAAYSRVTSLFARFECRVDVLLFRAGWFTEILNPFQLVYHGFVSINGRVSASPFECVSVGQFVTLAESLFNRRSVRRRVQKRKFVFPSTYILISEYLPVLVIFKSYEVKHTRILPNVNKFNILKYSY